MTSRLIQRLVAAVVVICAVLSRDVGGNGLESQPQLVGIRSASLERRTTAPAHVLALRGGKGFGAVNSCSGAVAAEQQVCRSGDGSLEKKRWIPGKDSHSPSGLSPKGDFLASCDMDCVARSSSLSTSSESLGSRGISKLTVDQDGCTDLASTAMQSRLRLKKGDMLNENNQVVGVIGSGAFGTVYGSVQLDQNSCVAVKVQRAGSKYSQVSLDELELLQVVGRAREEALRRGDAAGGECLVELRETFLISNPVPQICMSFEMLGPSLLDLIIDHGYRGIPLNIVRKIAQQCLKGLDFLHEKCDIIHTDVKPENILLTLPKGGEEPVPGDGVPTWWAQNSAQAWGAWELRKGWSERLEGQVGAKLCDLGNSCFSSHHYSENIQTIEYRSPEVILGAGYSTAADIWSLACTIFELVTGEYLFDPHAGSKYTREEDLLAHHQELLGAFPKEFALSGRLSDTMFDTEGNMKHVSGLRFWKLFDVLTDKYKWACSDAKEFCDFLLPMLVPDPKARATARDRLSHPWLSVDT